MNILIISLIKYNYIKRVLLYDKIYTNKNEKIVISIRIENEKINRIDEIASKIDISRNELINQCLDFALENLEFSSKEKSN